jgi:hypothetical protein
VAKCDQTRALPCCLSLVSCRCDPDYRDAFLTILKDPMTGHRDLINVRSRGAQGDATGSRTCDVCRYGVGCASVPIDLDPTILSTGLAGLNQIGDVANVRTTVFWWLRLHSTSTTLGGSLATDTDESCRYLQHRRHWRSRHEGACRPQPRR